MDAKQGFDRELILFVGAGASAALGMPTTSQFIELLKGRWPNLNALLDTYRKYGTPEHALNRSQPVVDSEYLRDWLFDLKRSAESIEYLSQHEPFATKVPKTENAVKFLEKLREDFDTFTRSAYSYVTPDKAYQHYFRLLEGLRSNKIDVVPVFTTNYDLVFESMRDCNTCQWRIETGMKQTGQRVLLDTKLYDQVGYDRPTLLIYKLHGSTDWWMKKGSGQVEQIPLDHKGPEDCHDLMIYPTRKKFDQMKEKPYSFYYDRLKNHLSSDRLRMCIAVGYSFRDKPINEMFVESLRKGLTLVIFDKTIKKQVLLNEFSKDELSGSRIDGRIHIHNHCCPR